MNQSFPKGRRLQRKAEFDRVFQRRRSAADELLILYACENGLEYSRLGLAVSKKAGGAVTRARWKRCLREAFRLSAPELPTGIDFVALPRAGVTPTTASARASLLKLAQRIGKAVRTGPFSAE